ncbi:fimbria/pilus outer membrane usher protein [Sphingomonas yabuuchiae]|uniref:Outer membrane usher protein n=1 Tax=Sphingomonas yabuuchiae TaxID=172044 RepID=A0AA40ZWR3_9SPHN|nr:fimbria/pilus outer membrane usher protein [Sphingomonas yabuuchiae]MBB4610749.1 outer membrane usher protein [Sphingomonas yabuuchiae]MBN3557237.1 fimbrial biogenesis outer membrane usher protein [Sphingomonas yabuuchiae]
MRPSRAGELAGIILATLACAQTAGAQDSESLRVGVDVDPSRQEQALQLEVYLNDKPTGYVASFTQRADGSFTAPVAQLRTLGVKVPPDAETGDVPLERISGLRYRYEQMRQIMWLAAGPTVQNPTLIDGGRGDRSGLTPDRPPFGAVLDYTLFASGDRSAVGPRFTGASGAFGTRVFGAFGLFESSAVGLLSGGPRFTRLATSYSYEDPRRLVTLRAGDTINGGHAWTRPIRMAGLQIQRTFGMRPDLVTMPVPRLLGSAAAPSTLDLFIDRVRTLSADVPQGPYAVMHPPIVQGAGVATVVVRDALGRETVQTAPFYASPQLLAEGLTDFSAEVGFARRSYAILSNDYDRRLIGSASVRRGMTDRLTLQGHAELGAGLVQLGAGGVVTLRDQALLSLAGVVSQAGGRTGGLVDIAFETRRSGFSVLIRSMRAIGRYEDLASRTSSFGPILVGDRRIFGAPREVDQFSLSLPIAATSASVGVSLVNSKTAAGDRYRLASLSSTANVGRLSLFANAVADLSGDRSFGLFVGASLPFGRRASVTTGATVSEGRVSGYAEMSRQGAHEPGSWGWSVRVADGRERAGHAIVRHTTGFAQFEATGLYAGGNVSGTLQAEGAVALIGGDLYAARRLDQSFAVADAGASGVRVYRENRLVGTTGASGKLLVPDIAPFEPSAISIDPSSLPVDARIASTHAEAVAFTRVPALIAFGVARETDAALVEFVDGEGRLLPLGSGIARPGLPEDVVGYDGAAFLSALGGQNEAIVTDPDGRRCRARFPFAAQPGEQVRIRAVCTPMASAAP